MSETFDQTDPPPVTGNNHKHPPPRSCAARYEVERTILRMAIAAHTLDEMAAETGLDADEVKSVLTEGLTNLRAFNHAQAAHLRDIQHGRLEIATRAIWPQVLMGDVKAVQQLVSISKRMSELWGLDAPTKMALTDPSGSGLKNLRVSFEAE